MVIVLGRTSIAALTLLLVGNAIKIPMFRIPKKICWLLMFTGALLYFHWWAFFEAIKLSTVSVALIGFSTFPLFVYIFEIWFMEEPFHIKNLMAIFLALIGVIVFLVKSLVLVASGFLVGVLSGLLFAVFSVMNKKLVHYISAISITFYQNFIAAVAAFIFFLPDFHIPSISTIMLLMLLGVFSTGLAHTLFVFSMNKISARTAGVFAMLEPVYGLLLAFIFLNESLKIYQILGSCLIIVAGVLLYLFENIHPE